MARVAAALLKDSMDNAEAAKKRVESQGADDMIPDERQASPSSDSALDPAAEQTVGSVESGQPHPVLWPQSFDQRVLAKWLPSWLPAQFHVYLSSLLLIVSFVVSCNEIHLLNFLWISAVLALCGWSKYWVRAGDVFAIATVGIMIVQYAFRFQIWQGVMKESWIKQIGLQWKEPEVVRHSCILFLCIAQKHCWYRSHQGKSGTVEVRPPKCPPWIARHADIVGIMVVLLVAAARRHLWSALMVLATLPWLLREEVPWKSEGKSRKRTAWLCFFRFVLLIMLLFQLVVRLGVVFDIKGRLDGIFEWFCRYWDEEQKQGCIEDYIERAQMNNSNSDALIWEFIAVFVLGYFQRLLRQTEDESPLLDSTWRFKLLAIHWWPCLVWVPIFVLSLEGGTLLGICGLGMLFGVTFSTDGSRLVRRRWVWRTRICATAFLIGALLVQSPTVPCSRASCEGKEHQEHQIFMKHDRCIMLEAMNLSVVATEAQMRECAVGGNGYALGHDTPLTMALQIVGLRRVVQDHGFVSDVGVLLGSQIGWLLLTIFVTTVQIRIYNSDTYKRELDTVFVMEEEGIRVQRAVRYIHEFHCRGGLERLAHQERHRALRSKLKRIMTRIHQILTSTRARSARLPGSEGSAAGHAGSGSYAILEEDQHPIAVEEIQLSHGVTKDDAEMVVNLWYEDVQVCKRYLDLLEEVAVGRIQPEGDLLQARVHSLVNRLHVANNKVGSKRLRTSTGRARSQSPKVAKKLTSKSVWARIVTCIHGVQSTLSRWYSYVLSWWADFKCSPALAKSMWDYAFLGVDEQKFKLKSLQEIAVEELHAHRLHNSPFRILWKLFLSHSLGLCGVAVVLAFIETRSVFDFLRVIAVFFVALRWYPFPPRELWTGVKIYSVVLLLLRYFYDFPVFCSKFTLRTLMPSRSSRQDFLWEPDYIFTWCPALLEAGADVTLGIAKRTGPSAMRETWWLWAVWADHLCIWAILLHEWMLTRSGVWDFVAVDSASQQVILKAGAEQFIAPQTPTEEQAEPESPAASVVGAAQEASEAPSPTAASEIPQEIPQEGTLHAVMPPCSSPKRPGRSMTSTVATAGSVQTVDFDEDTHLNLVKIYKKRRDEFIAKYEDWVAEVRGDTRKRKTEEKAIQCEQVEHCPAEHTPRRASRTAAVAGKMHKVAKGMRSISFASVSTLGSSSPSMKKPRIKAAMHMVVWAMSGGSEDLDSNGSEVDNLASADVREELRQALSDPILCSRFEKAFLIQKWVRRWVRRMRAEMRIRCPLGHRLCRCRHCEETPTSSSISPLGSVVAAEQQQQQQQQRQQVAAAPANPGIPMWAEPEVCERCFQPILMNDADSTWWHCKHCSYFACNNCVQHLLETGLGMGRQGETKTHLKRGMMLYWLKFACGLFLLVYAMLANKALVDEERSFSESVQESSFGVWTVVMLVGHICLLIVDRIWHKLYYRNGINAVVLDYINGAANIVAFIILHAIVIHSVLEVSNQRQAQLPLHSNPALFGYYVIWMVYMGVCMAQYKHGLPAVDSDLLRPTTAPESQGFFQERIRMIYFLVHYHLPFVDDLRVIIDWTVVRTSLDLWMFFKVEDAHSWLFRIRHQMFTRRQSWYAEERGCLEKLATGWLLLFALLVVILMPVVLFSPITPFLEHVPIQSAVVALEMSVATACTGYRFSSSCSSLSVRLHEASATGIFEWRYNKSLLEWYLKKNPMVGTDLDIQEVVWPEYSHSILTVSPPVADHIADLLNSAQLGGDNVMVMFQLKLDLVQDDVTRATTPFQACSCSGSSCSSDSVRWPAGMPSCEGPDAPSLLNQTRDWWSWFAHGLQNPSPAANASAGPVLILEDFWAPALALHSGSTIPQLIQRTSLPKSDGYQYATVDLRLQLGGGSSGNCTGPLAGGAHGSGASVHDRGVGERCDGSARWGKLAAVDGSRPLRVVFELEKQAPIEESSSWGSVMGLYVGLVFVVGKYLRAAFQDSSKRCVYEEIPDVGVFLDLVTAVQLAREHGDLRTEFQLYYELMKVLRSTDLLLTSGGFEVEGYGVGRTDRCPPECVEPQHNRALQGYRHIQL